MRILITGASGFVGQRVCYDLATHGFEVRQLVHEANKTRGVMDADIAVGDITDTATIMTAMRGMDAVVHLAARVHVMKDRASDPLAAYRSINVEGTRILLHAARDTRIRHFVLASSVKAVGETSYSLWRSSTPAHPVDPYGVSKLEAEALVHAARGNTMSTTILRFPLVYGPGMRGNMVRLFELVSRGWPIPVATENARSILFVGNAAAAIRRVMETAARGNTDILPGPFFLSDGDPISTWTLVHDVAVALGKRPRTIRLPTQQLEWLAGRSAQGSDPRSRLRAIVNRLAGSLEVDQKEFQDAFSFTPPFTRAEGIAETARWFLAR